MMPVDRWCSSTRPEVDKVVLALALAMLLVCSYIAAVTAQETERIEASPTASATPTPAPGPRAASTGTLPRCVLALAFLKAAARTYEENVEILPFKRNIALVGEGRDTTVITGSRSAADGRTTIRTATFGPSCSAVGQHDFCVDILSYR